MYFITFRHFSYQYFFRFIGTCPLTPELLSLNLQPTINNITTAYKTQPKIYAHMSCTRCPIECLVQLAN